MRKALGHGSPRLQFRYLTLLAPLLLLGSSHVFAQSGVQKPITEPTVPPVDYGQETSMHHHHHTIEEVMSTLPKIGMSKTPLTGPIYKLDDLEQIALTHNPTLAEAQHSVDAAQGVRRQVGLLPNPSVGYSGDEIRGGSFKSGKQGFFVEQPFIMGGKLTLNRKIEDQIVHRMDASRDAQQFKVRNATRQAYFHVLAAQEMLNLKESLAQIAHTSSEYVHELQNTGQADETEVLQSEIAEQQVLIAVEVEKNELHRRWTELCSILGNVELPLGMVQGDIEALPEDRDESKVLANLIQQSPEMHFAQSEVECAQATLVRARREPIPDIVLKVGLQQDNEPLETPQSRTGLVGFAEIGAELHLFNRNQGNVEADQADFNKAKEELRRVELSLRSQLAGVEYEYRSDRLAALRYREQILPRTEHAYTLMIKQYGLMDAAFPRVLTLQRELFQANVSYIRALEAAQTSYVAIDGFLYSGGLDAPGTAMTMKVGDDLMVTSPMMPINMNEPNIQSSIFDNGLTP